MELVLPILEISGASYVIEKLVDNATNYVRDQYYLKTNLEEESKSLKRLLIQIRAIVSYAEPILTSYESSNSELMDWLKQFRDGIYETEEVLDELEYLVLEKKANSDKSRLHRTVDASFKLLKVDASVKLPKVDDLLKRLKTCVKDLNNVASSAQNFLIMVTHAGGIRTGQMPQVILPFTDQSRITSSLPVLSFIGREEEKGKIIQYLLGESVEESEIQSSENVHCIPLVAMGGMGKTALAQQVFDHFENFKKKHFDIKIWVCDSLPDLNASRLMKKILKYSTGRSESDSLEELSAKLKEELHSKRFLLVLDDAWDDKNKTEWKTLCAPLLYGQKGSWILLTTRLESVAKVVSKEITGTMEPMMLRGLSKDECRSLLYEHAFAGRDPNEFPQLKEIGKEISEKLDGVPLLAKLIGGTLNSKLETDHWTNISRSKVWNMPQDYSKFEFIPALTLSYAMLPPRLKRCFSYCSIFPQGYKFNKQKLVCMWVAAGLIYPEGLEEGSDEDIANCCFEMLCHKSFFDVHTDNRSTFSIYETGKFLKSIESYGLGKDYYTMHDTLNGLARYVSRYECCRIVPGAPSMLNKNYNAIRHISIASCTDAQLLDVANTVCKFKYLRTLWIQYDGHPKNLDDFIRQAFSFESPRKIRVLIIESIYSRVPDLCLKSISYFVKLRFLDISAHLQPTSLSLLICKFYFLQVLIDDGYRRPSLTEDSNKLTNLRHLYGLQDGALFSVAKVGKLTSLQELCFSVGTKPGYRIDELMNMDNLYQLKIKQLSNVTSFEEATTVNLVRKRHLTRLELDWNGVSKLDDVSNPDGVSDPRQVLDALKPSPRITELIIRGYKGGIPASWMDTPSLSQLETLQLYSCTSLEVLPPLWKLPCLKFLSLNDMKAIKSLGCDSQIDTQFPVLEALEFRGLPLWVEWNSADDYIWFPQLKSFEIYDCPKLKKIPDLPLSIENLKMEYLGLEALPRFYECSNGSRTFRGFQQLMSLKCLRIFGCPNIVQIGSIGEEDDNLLPSSLKTLELEIFDEHKYLASYLRGLTSLTNLSFRCSPSLESLPLVNEPEHLTTP